VAAAVVEEVEEEEEAAEEEGDGGLIGGEGRAHMDESTLKSMDEITLKSMDEITLLRKQLRCMTAEKLRLDALVAEKDVLMAEKAAVMAEKEAEKEALVAEKEALVAESKMEIARLKESLRAADEKAAVQEVGLSPEYEELRAKFELLEQMYQPVQTENEQRKEMLTDLRKAAIGISRSRQDLHFPTKRMGEIDSMRLHRLGISIEQISRLQQTICDPNFHPWRTRQVRPGSEEVETVVNWDDDKLQGIVRVCGGGTNSKGRQAAEEVLRCSKELQQWNPSGGYCVTIPYHYGEQRELKPDELLKIAAGVDVAGCRAAEGNGGAGASAAVTGHARPPRSQAPRAPRAASWSNVVSSRSRGRGRR
jgi:hypothetical protein